MTTEAKPLNEAQLARYLGAECEYEIQGRKELDKTRVWLPQKGPLSLGLIALGSYVRNIRPLLRPLASISEDEAREVFRLGYSRERDIELIKKENYVLISYENYRLWIFQNGAIDFTNHPWINAVAVIDYLRSLHFDLESLIEQGLAVQKGGQGA